jgi:hypothetical protein
MLDARITGAAQLRQVAKAIKAAGDKGLSKELSAALRKAGGKPVQAAIRREADAVMPSRGGYQGDFGRSLRFRTTIRAAGRTASVRLVTFADGTRERRDIRALDRGLLRHPVYGRSRRLRGGARQANPWAVTRIRSGFHDRGTARAADDAEREIGVVLDAFADRLLKG